MAKTSDAVKILHKQIEDDTELKEMLDTARLNADIAQMVYDAGMTVNLTQKQLSHLVGTTESVISRLEDADYEGHSLSMLQRIAAALNRKLEIKLV